jgi:small-conductance mechanosensitive channel
LGVLLLQRVLKRIAARRIEKLAERTKSRFDDLLVRLVARTYSLLMLPIAVYAGSVSLMLPAKTSDLLGLAALLALLLQAAVWGNEIINFAIKRFIEDRVDDDASAATTVSALGLVSKVALWTVLILLALDNAGIDIGTLVASLGIGGIAVALALQNILGDLFASLSIAIDKPFVIGDFIIVGDLLGTVEDIGIKTTRVRSLYGEQLIFSNNDLLSSRIRNFKRMFERRVVFSLGVTYQTPNEKLRQIPLILQEIIEEHDATTFDRAHFKSFGDSGLIFEVVYYVRTPDYNVYVSIEQAINWEIHRRFGENGIDFAYPTRTVFVEGAGVGKV